MSLNIKKIIKEELDYFESGKWIEDESTPLDWLRNNFSDLSIQKVFNNWYDKEYYDESGWIFFQDSKRKEIWVSYDKIWSKLKSEFSLNRVEIREILTYWLEEDYKLKGFTPGVISFSKPFTLEEDYKLKGFTPKATND
jgi:hypothetical protein